ncbi:SET domain-containing protein [Wolfiporia cocos MD-104 SS10]|uniref:SET domain-containing protein n=1 Tax=Wolfiporia cocos (strain MD-104) TaxID=742152 RepID=A0A2H3JTS9_WOLCO|nr:SET domain-containing protein [Wolfiporia cocos MD-104 SS10]
MNAGRLSQLLMWCSKNGISIDPDIHFVDDPHTGIAVFSNRPIASCTTLATIPKSALLSVRSCSVSEHIPFVPYGHGAHLALSFALHAELARGEHSKWFGYLQSLPQRPVPIAIFWGIADALLAGEDAREARMWITGTSVDEELVDENGNDYLDEARKYYQDVVQPVLARLRISSTLGSFLHAYSLVSSRAFLVDAYHGLSMVPIADAFNHASDNHVHLESDFDVCPICGDLAECSHDRGDASNARRPHEPQSRTTANMDTVDMCTNRAVPVHAEVFNTYGSRLGNAALLARYGFALDENGYDAVTLHKEDIWGASVVAGGYENGHAAQRAPISEEFLTDVYREWSRSRWSLAVDVSVLVYVPEGLYTISGCARRMYINNDVQVSVQAWLCCAICTIILGGEDASLDTEDIVMVLGKAMSAQVQIESALQGDDEAHTTLDIDEEALTVVNHTARTLSLLCTRRSTNKAHNMEELDNLLNVLPENRLLTRWAISLVLAERAVLESCAAAWQGLVDVLESSRHTA